VSASPSLPSPAARDLALDVWYQITRHPETHYQPSYRCGAGMCVAGWAAQLAGGRWLCDDLNSEWRTMLRAEPGDVPGRISDLSLLTDASIERESFILDSFHRGPGECVTFNAPVIPVVDAYERARRLLELDDEAAERLFDGSNGVGRIRELLTQYLGADPEELLTARNLRDAELLNLENQLLDLTTGDLA